MHASQQTREENFSEEEKIRLEKIFRKRLLPKSILYLFLIGGSVIIIIYFNFFTDEIENLWLLNLAFAVNIALCGRVYLVKLFSFRNEVRATVKKIVDTRIVKHEGDKIFIGNQQFKKEDILLDAPGFETLKAGDKIRVEHSAVSHIIFSVKRI